MDFNENQFLKVTCISDTHSHIFPKLSPGDILIHAGDFTQCGSDEEIEQFIKWLDNQSFKYKIVVPGNHDLAFDQEYFRHKNHKNNDNSKIIYRMKEKCYFLIDEAIEIEGYLFYGSPYSLEWWHGAFQLKHTDSKQQWQKIPQNTDILITHGPPFSYGDRIDDKNVGDQELLLRVREIQPKFHIFGHIHEGYCKIDDQNGTTFINCAQLDKDFRIRKPIEFKLSRKQI